jgi:hypothetical protein
LSGFADADKAALDSLRVPEDGGMEILGGAEAAMGGVDGVGAWDVGGVARGGDGGPLFPPEALDAVADAPRPAGIQLCHPVLEETGTRELFLIAYAAFAEAFFGQFGQSAAEDVELPPPPEFN